MFYFIVCIFIEKANSNWRSSKPIVPSVLIYYSLVYFVLCVWIYVCYSGDINAWITEYYRRSLFEDIFELRRPFTIDLHNSFSFLFFSHSSLLLVHPNATRWALLFQLFAITTFKKNSSNLYKFNLKSAEGNKLGHRLSNNKYWRCLLQYSAFYEKCTNNQLFRIVSRTVKSLGKTYWNREGG